MGDVKFSPSEIKRRHVRKQCLTCDMPFFVTPSRAHIVYCSNSCARKGKAPWNKGLKGIPSPKKGKKYGPHMKKRRKGIEPWNKGKKTGLIPHNKKEHIDKICEFCGDGYAVIPSLDRVRYCSRSCARRGKARSVETRKKISESTRGEKNWRWKGGSEEDRNERHVAMRRMEYKEWRTAVFQRDSYACRECGDNKYVEAHHIFGWKDYPELRYDVRNGYALCRPCHKKADRGEIVIIPAIVPERYYQQQEQAA